MKNFTLIALSSALMLGLASCEKTTPDSGGDATVEEKSITIRLQSGSGASSAMGRAIEAPLANGEAVTVADGLVYFLSSQGNVLSLKDMDINTIFSVTGQNFTGINGSATNVYIVGNYKAVTPSIEATLRAANSLTQVKAVTAQVSTQQTVGPKGVMVANVIDAVGNAAYDGLIKFNSANSKNEAFVLLAPVMTRIQLTDIKTSDPKIVDFTFEGIYVDNFYKFLSPATDKSGTAPLLTVGTDNLLLGTLAPNMQDVATPTVVAGADKTVTAADAKGVVGSYMWGYQVATTGTTGTDIARLIVKLSSVMVVDNSGATVDIGPQYITITGYTDGSGNPINQLTAGKVYQIPAGAFDFSLDKLGTTPNAAKKDVVVYAKVLGWTIANVGVIM